MQQTTRAEVRIRVGRWIAESRAERSVTQLALAQKVAVTQASISNYENARRDIPLWVMLGIIEALGADPASLLRQLVHR